MRLAISNISWDTSEDEEIANLLQRFSVDAIDIAPGKYFPDPSKATDEEIALVKGWWSVRGIEITGMQALLFGTSGLNVFGTAESQSALIAHLAAVCRIGAGLGATRVVFGSPKNRDRSGLDDQEALGVAIPFFRKLGDIAQASGVTICLEPNPSCYGSNFMTTSAETAIVVKHIAHPSIRMQLDTGALTINGEDPMVVLNEYADLIGHVHASEPDLLPLGDGGTGHGYMALALAKYLPSHVVTIEMAATKEEAHAASIERALLVATKHYLLADVGAGA
ncbi:MULTISPECIES: sugar phosphate isomerase/epimerase family protein [unclassified Pseudomonas]|uniref:sugar phosphate isomerase/epimerase family protein n=1 Tax=unclassified Pseudomonas TaxID=196821 RepID=UPI00146290B3|nr:MULTISPECIES: TIM barrel protein [unclassified Pseudomonas]QJI20330.1 sugar phosphate isomerase/epimerase [Pseudomonas sp. ADAK21]QJI24516.1 sugar phosphate isomerase/epimerase [Pseudomonas sp. ADAK20]